MALIIATIRGLLAVSSLSWAIILPVQLLEGAAMGLASVAIPALIASIMKGSGQGNAALAALLSAVGAGATVSSFLAGFAAAFLILAAIAAAGLGVWIVGRRLVTMPTDALDGVS